MSGIPTALVGRDIFFLKKNVHVGLPEIITNKSILNQSV